MGPKSNSLFHFTKSVDFLTGILDKGFLPRYCLEDNAFLGIDYVGYPMTCFCDIPISRLAEHSGFYGNYGIGMTKEWGLKNALAPVLYTPLEGVIPALANYLLYLNMKDGAGNQTPEQKALNDHFYRLVSLTKPIQGNMYVGGTVIQKDFSQENEWRYVPKGFNMLFKEHFEESREESNAAVADQKLSFSPSDVKYIFVNTDAEIPKVFDFIQNNLGQFPHNDIKILTTRIVSLETLHRDI